MGEPHKRLVERLREKLLILKLIWPTFFFFNFNITKKLGSV
jgi:hypothetical protein